MPISEGFVTAGAGERPLACVQTKMALQYPRPIETLVAEWAGMTATIIASAVVIVYFYCRLLYMCINYFINPDETLKIYTFFNLHFVHCRWHTLTSSTRENLTFTFCLLDTYRTLHILAVNLWYKPKTYTIAWCVQFSQWILTVKTYFLAQW